MGSSLADTKPGNRLPLVLFPVAIKLGKYKCRACTFRICNHETETCPWFCVLNRMTHLEYTMWPCGCGCMDLWHECDSYFVDFRLWVVVKGESVSVIVIDTNTQLIQNKWGSLSDLGLKPILCKLEERKDHFFFNIHVKLFKCVSSKRQYSGPYDLRPPIQPPKYGLKLKMVLK